MFVQIRVKQLVHVVRPKFPKEISLFPLISKLILFQAVSGSQRTQKFYRWFLEHKLLNK